MISKKKKQAKKIKKAKLKKNLAIARGDQEMVSHFEQKILDFELPNKPNVARSPEQIEQERARGVFRTASGHIKL